MKRIEISDKTWVVYSCSYKEANETIKLFSIFDVSLEEKDQKTKLISNILNKCNLGIMITKQNGDIV